MLIYATSRYVIYVKNIDSAIMCYNLYKKDDYPLHNCLCYCFKNFNASRYYRKPYFDTFYTYFRA